MKYRGLIIGWGLMCWLAALNSAFAQGTAFTYQGNLLLNAAPANGNYDLQFILHPQSTGSNQVGVTLTNAPTGVTNGLFNVVLDFGNVYGINPLYLEIDVRTNGSTNAYTVLSPTQLLTSAPYAVQALNSRMFTGAISDAQLSPNIPLLDSNSLFSAHVTFSNATGAFSGTFNGSGTGSFAGTLSSNFTGTATGKFIGDGSGVTNVNITNVVGIVQSNPNWQLVSVSAQQAVAGINYLTTNPGLTTLVLPANPGVGTTLRFAGSGANGWVITQNAGQSIITATLGLPAGQQFAQTGNSLSWQALAASANGLRPAAGYGSAGFIYYSADGGQTWNQSDSPQLNWTGLAASADGLRMVAVPNSLSSRIYTSTNGGVNWVSQAGSTPENYTSVASSADGVNLVAVPGSTGETIFTSNNGGTNWTARISGQDWVGVTSSADGTKIAALANGASLIYSSMNSGASWVSNGPLLSWSAIAGSASGSKLVATANGGYIYTSGDGGVTWTPHASSQSWKCVTSSANGMNLAAAYSLGYIYTSSDSGLTWVQRTTGVPSGMQAWSAITSSSDGSRLVAAISTGYLYISTATTTIGTGSLTGSQYSNIELQYIGNGQWMPLSAYGSFTGN